MDTLINKLIEAGLKSVTEKLSSQAVEKLGSVLSSAWEWLGNWGENATDEQTERVTRALVRAAEQIPEDETQPKTLPLRMIKPWVEGVSVEERELLQDMWSSLLANAADSRPSRKRGHRSFLEIMLQLDVGDVMLLNALYHIDSQDSDATVSYHTNQEIREAFERIGYSRSIDDEELQFAKVNLSRLGLCVRQLQGGGGGSGVFASAPTWEAKDGPSRVQISAFGRAFYEATQPPESTE